MIWRYPSVFGNQGNVEVDLNFMYRKPLLPVVMKNSVPVLHQTLRNIAVLDIHELAAGKLSALIHRCAARDLFDAHYLLNFLKLDHKKLREIFVLYSTTNRKVDIRTFSVDDIHCNFKDFQHSLYPMLKLREFSGIKELKKLHNNLMYNVKTKLSALIQLKDNETQFLNNLLDKGEIVTELLMDKKIAQNAMVHPGLLWTAHNVRRDLAHH